ncbi:MAG: ribose-phosphate pyrophosphokinase [Candidatus Woesearchaeota archaeon]
MLKRRGELRLLACEAGRPFAEKILQKLLEKGEYKEARIIDSKEIQFANSEIKTKIGESIRDADVYIIQDVENSVHGKSIDENLRALKTAIDAAWRSDARYVTAVLPAFPYARQDKQDGREGITASLIAREIEAAGADHVITLDIHNTAIAGFFRKAKFDNLNASKNIMSHILKNPELFNLKNMVIMPPDLGGAKRAERYARKLGTDLVFVHKKRSYTHANVVEDAVIIGDISGKDVLIVDDMICTGGTLIKVIKLVKQKGANKVYAACSLPLFNGNAIQNLTEAYEADYLSGVIGTDAVHHGKDFAAKCPWFREVDIASYFAKVIRKLNHRESLSELLQ